MLNSDDITIFITLPSISNVTQGAYPTNARKPDIGKSKEEESIKTHFEPLKSEQQAACIYVETRGGSIIPTNG